MSTASDPVAPELVERFRASLERLNPEGGKIGLAVSGGPDSMAMLLLAHAAIPGAFEVATVDHGLRAEAKDECALVAAACKVRGVPCELLRVEVGEGNLQAEARKARYEELEEFAISHGLVALATAHHADDQAETLLMRLNRGSGLTGLSGVREFGRTDLYGWPIYRPLLGFRRSELRAIVEQAGIAYATDPSNGDDSFERVRVRQAIAGADWIDPVAWAQSASHLAEADEALDTAIMFSWSQLATVAEGEVRVRADMPPVLARNLCLRAFAMLKAVPRGSDVARLVGRLERGKGGNLAGILVTIEGNEWVFRPEPPRQTG